MGWGVVEVDISSDGFFKHLCYRHSPHTDISKRRGTLGLRPFIFPSDLLMAVDSAINNAYFIVFYKTDSFTALAIKN